MFGLWQVELNPDVMYLCDDTNHVISAQACPVISAKAGMAECFS